VGVRAIDDYTLEVELEEPAAYFLNLLAIAKLMPVPRHVVERFGPAWTAPEHLVTNGPFRLQDWKPGHSITLMRNPTYFGHFRGNLSNVEFIVPDQMSTVDRMAAYRDGLVDILDLEPDTIQARQHFANEYQQSNSFATFYLAFNLMEPPFDDRRVRQAMALAIDKEALANGLLGGIHLPGSGGFLPPGFPGYSPDIGLPYDAEQARQLLEDAGYPDGNGFPPMDLVALRQGSHSIIARALPEVWQKVLDIEVNPREMAREDFERQFLKSPLFTLGWVADYPDPDSILRIGSRYAARGWRNKGFDQLIVEATRSTDPVTRLGLYRMADRILMEEAVIVPTIYSVRHLLVKPWVKTKALRIPILKDVIIEPH
jgi:oligopeptide transport system substrate-binding protein